jgi:hypothetical protein
MIAPMKGRDYTDNSQIRHQDLRMKGRINYTIAANFKKNTGVLEIFFAPFGVYKGLHFLGL